MTLPFRIQRCTLIHFGAAISIENVVWETAHRPLYSLKQTDTRSKIAYP